MAGARRREREKIGPKRALMGGAIRPKGATRLPKLAQAFVMGDRVLNDKRLNSFRVGKRHAEAHGAAVILHIERVTRQTDRLGEVVHHRRDMVESVIKRFGVRPVPMPEPGRVGRKAARTSAMKTETRAARGASTRRSARPPGRRWKARRPLRCDKKSDVP